jgi:hypothetical protein
MQRRTPEKRFELKDTKMWTVATNRGLFGDRRLGRNAGQEAMAGRRAHRGPVAPHEYVGEQWHL